MKNIENYRDRCIALLEDRGVTIYDIADAARFLQADYHKGLKAEEFFESIMSVLDKREVQFAIMTAIELDRQAENGTMIDKELEDVLRRDEGLYGVDEVNAYGICNLYGSISLTNFGFIDKKKYGIIAKLNEEGKDGVHCHTFLDDIVGAIAASAAGRFAHSRLRSKREEV
ncbi:MAG: phosphatidylglycerophosphatase A [Bacilli bacterium]|jgi:phosphatidylglycerophosphatase A|nr:phosphatidylglycerophosphatase A [Bacilli bacterium]MDD3389238.1 phosphatidylglycerophosphatase A [Bacilli bacterium]MDD4345066.1 phosphatidylglycerophosphatase A [Bacilli bacterium]MDD4520977.1 phosphatidylglycerophosphatase A [Bacilli bacterium]MDY0399723.1 phosphatidylglycerophosphatase A [Bacilli bacterium]